MKSKCHFNVRPRYSAGSPGMVSEKIAKRVAEEEQQAYQRHLSGVYGEDAIKEAQEKGLTGIADKYEEKRDHWLVTDLITGEVYRKLFSDVPMTKKRMTHIQQNIQNGWKIKRAWRMDSYVIVEYHNGQREKLYKAKLEWIREIEPDAELIH